MCHRPFIRPQRAHPCAEVPSASTRRVIQALSSEPLFLGHEGATRTIVPQLQKIVTTITGPTVIRVCHPLIRPGIELRLRLGDHIIACKQLPYMDEGVCLCTDLATHVDTLRPPRGRDQAPHTSPQKL